MVAKKKHINSPEPATKGDLEDLREDLQADIFKVTDRIDTRMEGMEQSIDTKMEQWKDEIVRHFDVVAENIHQDVAGANRDEISMIKDKVQHHDADIAILKQKISSPV